MYVCMYVCIVGCRGASQLGGSLVGIPPGFSNSRSWYRMWHRLNKYHLLLRSGFRTWLDQTEWSHNKMFPLFRCSLFRSPLYLNGFEMEAILFYVIKNQTWNVSSTVGIRIPNIRIPESFENRTFWRSVQTIRKPD